MNEIATIGVQIFTALFIVSSVVRIALYAQGRSANHTFGVLPAALLLLAAFLPGSATVLTDLVSTWRDSFGTEPLLATFLTVFGVVAVIAACGALLHLDDAVSRLIASRIDRRRFERAEVASSTGIDG